MQTQGPLVQFCFACGRKTGHELRYLASPDFIGRLLVCADCGGTIREPLGAAGCSNC